MISTAKDKDAINEKGEKMVIKKNYYGGGPSGAVYGLGLIGALIYFIQNAHTFQAGVIGLLKSLVWPALLVYKVLQVWKF